MAGLVRPSSKKIVGADGRLALEWDAFFSALLNAVNTQSFTVASVPSAADVGIGSVIYVSDETDGPVLAFSDGTDWRRVTDRAIIS